MSERTDATQVATSFLHLLQRFTGNQPDALAQMREQVQNELGAAREMVRRAEAQLAAIDQLQTLIDEAAESETSPISEVRPVVPPLKTAILRVLDERPDLAWHRDELYAEIVRRGWGPGGANPRNTFTSRLRDLELDGRLRRVDRDIFASKKEVSAL